MRSSVLQNRGAEARRGRAPVSRACPALAGDGGLGVCTHPIHVALVTGTSPGPCATAATLACQHHPAASRADPSAAPVGRHIGYTGRVQGKRGGRGVKYGGASNSSSCCRRVQHCSRRHRWQPGQPHGHAVHHPSCMTLEPACVSAQPQPARRGAPPRGVDDARTRSDEQGPSVARHERLHARLTPEASLGGRWRQGERQRVQRDGFANGRRPVVPVVSR